MPISVTTPLRHKPAAKAGRGLFAALAALALTISAAAPVQALGRNERNVLKGVAGTLIVGAIVNDYRQRQAQAPNYVAPSYPAPVYQPPRQASPPVYYTQPTYATQTYTQPARRPARQPVYSNASIYNTPVAQAFNSYRPAERRVIQQRLASWGYYRSGVDGAFGPGTYNAILAYANDQGQSAALGRTASVYGLFDTLMY